MFRTRPSLLDLFAAFGVVLLALALLLFPLLFQKTGESLVVVTPEGSTSYDLSRDRVITVESRDIRLEIVIQNGAAFVRESSCPDGVCRAGGRISKSGQTLLCAPAGVIIRVEGGEGDVDIVAG